LNCKTIEFDDLEKLGIFLHLRFPKRSCEFWQSSIRAVYQQNMLNNSGCPCGFYMEDDTKVLAAILTIYSHTKNSVSLSSWAVSAEASHVSYPFIRVVLNRLKGMDVYNHSAVAGVDKLMLLLGFKECNKAVLPIPSLSFAALRFIFKSKLYKLPKNIIEISCSDQLIVRLKLISIRKNNNFRLLALLVGANTPISREHLRYLTLKLLLRGLILISPKPHYPLRSINLMRFRTMRKKFTNSSIFWENNFSESEYEIMDF
jgi:hypothetical protein